MSCQSSFGVPCAFHGEEIITNFCKCEQCYLPLCPKCIKLHLQDHKAQGTHAILESIDHSIREAQSSLSNIEKMITRTGQSIKDIQADQHALFDYINKRIAEMRTRVLKEVDLYINDLNQEMNRLLFEHNDSIEFRLGQVDSTIRSKLS